MNDIEPIIFRLVALSRDANQLPQHRRMFEVALSCALEIGFSFHEVESEDGVPMLSIKSPRSNAAYLIDGETCDCTHGRMSKKHFDPLMPDEICWHIAFYRAWGSAYTALKSAEV
jgi:hypothetical protein